MITNKWPWEKEYENDSELMRALSQEKNATFFQEICRKQPAPKKIQKILCACCTWPKRNRPDFVNLISELNSILDTDLGLREQKDPHRSKPVYSSDDDEDNFTSADSGNGTYSSYRSKHTYDSDD